MFKKHTKYISRASRHFWGWLAGGRHKGDRPKLFWRLFRLAVLLAALGFVGIVVSLAILSIGLPTKEEILNRQIPQSTKLYDRTGNVLLYELGGSEKRTVVPLAQIPQSLRDATIAIEDSRFYEEPAFDLRGITRAFFANLLQGRISQGGSTLTQQLAKNAFLSPERTLTRKLKELILAMRLAEQYSKDQILELYLNEVPYGPTTYGVEAASRTYFGKSVSDLSVAESALLAGITKAPSYYYPWGRHTKELFERQRLVLQKMRQLNKIDEQTYRKALEEKISFQPQGNSIKAPHFSFLVQDMLIEKYGEDLVRQGGLRIITTLDWTLQELAEKAVAEGAARNEELYQGKNAALVAEDPKTGEILALVGSRDYFDTARDGNFNVATQGLRQPGSTLKPFIYLSAFQKGYTPSTVVFDVPTEFSANNPNCPLEADFSSPPGLGCFRPQNFDGDFRGPVSLKTALAQSINIPAVKTLYLVGLRDALKNVVDFGLTTLNDPNRYGLSLVLGGGEVRLIDLVKAYSVLASEGMRREQAYILEVRDSQDKLLESYKDSSVRVSEAKYPQMINQILSDPDARAGLFQSSMNLTTFPGREVALKTGTTNDYRDAWVVGYTPSLVVGVWAGNNDNKPMQRRGTSILAAVPIWNVFMKEALDSRPKEFFAKPPLVSATKPMLDGNYFHNNEIHSILYYVDRKDPLGQLPNNPDNDPQFRNWEISVLSWARNNIPVILSGIATSTDEGAVRVTIKTPEPGFYPVGAPISVNAPIVAKTNIIRIVMRFNGEVIQVLENGDFGPNFLFNWSFTPVAPKDQNILEVEAETDTAEKGKDTTIIYIQS